MTMKKVEEALAELERNHSGTACQTEASAERARALVAAAREELVAQWRSVPATCTHREATFGCEGCRVRVRSRWKEFPLQVTHGSNGPVSVPWPVADRAWAAYSAEYGRGQSVERLAERGGFSWGEMDELLPGWREMTDEWTLLREQNLALEQAASDARSERDAAVADSAVWRAGALSVAPAIAVLARAPEVAPSIRSELLRVEAAFLVNAKSPSPGAVLLEIIRLLRQYQHRDEADVLATLKRLLEERNQIAHMVSEEKHRAALVQARDDACEEVAIRLIAQRDKPIPSKDPGRRRGLEEAAAIARGMKAVLAAIPER